MTETIAYVYKWTHKPTYKWYIGSRTRKGCNPDDGYICSSKIVKPMINANQDEWIREILFTGSVDEMRELEAELLDLFDAKNDIRSFNMHNNNGKFSFTGKKHSEKTRVKQSTASKGENNPFYGKKHTPDTLIKMSGENNPMYGRKHSEESRAKNSAALSGENNPMYGKIGILSPNYGRKHSEESRVKMSAKLIGKPHKIITCPHCSKSGGNAMKRWHFDNCKFKDNIDG